jgi:hypothetical protein
MPKPMYGLLEMPTKRLSSSLQENVPNRIKFPGNFGWKSHKNAIAIAPFLLNQPAVFIACIDGFNTHKIHRVRSSSKSKLRRNPTPQQYLQPFSKL